MTLNRKYYFEKIIFFSKLQQGRFQTSFKTGNTTQDYIKIAQHRTIKQQKNGQYSGIW